MKSISIIIILPFFSDAFSISSRAASCKLTTFSLHVAEWSVRAVKRKRNKRIDYQTSLISFKDISGIPISWTSKANKYWFEKLGSVRLRGGKQLWFESLSGSKNRGFEKSGFHMEINNFIYPCWTSGDPQGERRPKIKEIIIKRENIEIIWPTVHK